jgi:glycosyltransferase involved in cell wall biosynthesis
VSIFFDMIPAHFPEGYLKQPSERAFFDRRLDNYARHDLALCISKFSQDDLAKRHPELHSINIGAGLSPQFEALLRKRSFKRADDGADYMLLYVGGLDWRKNLPTLIEGYAKLPSHIRKTTRLVLVGTQPAAEKKALFDLWVDKGLPTDKLIFAGVVDDAKLAIMYKRANVLVQPSLMEGFGLTVLEAIRAGTPVAVANAGALAEIIGDASVMFDPTQPMQLTKLLHRLLTDGPFARRLVRRAKANSAHFEWARAAEKMDAALRRLCSAYVPGAANPSVPCDLIVKSRAAVLQQVVSLNLLDVPDAAVVLAAAEPAQGPAPKILIDTTSTAHSKARTGIQRVVTRLVDEMRRAKLGDVTSVYCSDEQGWFDTGLHPHAVPGLESKRIVPRPGQTLLMLDSSWDRYALHRPFLKSHRLLGNEVVSCLYDLVPLKTPAFCDSGMPGIFALWLGSALEESTAFVCISKAVADELLALLEAIDFPRTLKVGYFPLGADLDAGQPRVCPLSSQAHDFARPRFLIVGTLEPRKGHTVVLDAFDKLWSDGVDVELVIVGKPGWSTEALQHRISGHREGGGRLIWHECMEDDELARTYAESSALVAASYAEGFGLPLVEAGHFGKPVIASDIDVFKEVAVGAAGAIFFKRGSALDLARAVRDFLQNPPTPDESQVVWPDWKESATRIRQVIDGDWYAVHHPRQPGADTEAGNRSSLIDAVRMNGPLPKRAKVALSLVTLPESGENGECSVVVAVTNQSSVTWSSSGNDGVFAVNMGLANFDRSDMPSGPTFRTNIPLVVIPGETIYVRIVIPSVLSNNGSPIGLRMVQEGVKWFGAVLRIPQVVN